MSNYCIGIDFGTTSSCLSYYNIDSKQIVVIPNEQGSFTTPSKLFLNYDSSELLFGETVESLSDDKLSNIFSNIKRLIGCNNKNEDVLKFFKYNKQYIDKENKTDEIMFSILFDNNEKIINVKTLIKFYLSYLKSIVINYFGNKFNTKDSFDIVITVPAYFNDTQRMLLKECCESPEVNLNVLRIINEPTAASLAYAFDKKKLIDSNCNCEYILTFDSGGGTTDISLLYLDYVEEIYEVKNTVGDNFLGGEDITNNIINYIITKLKLDSDNLSLKNYNKIKKEAENAKKNLSFNLNHTIYLEIGECDYTLNISQIQFVEINKEFFGKIKNLIYYVLDDYISKIQDFSYNKITSIIFVGATTKIPYFKQIFKEILPNVYINDTIDPDQTISIGASIQGALLKDLISNDDGGETLLMDVLPLSIGIETIGGIMTPIVSRNNLIPVLRTKQFTNSSNDETIVINIYQGERKFVKDNTHLGSFELKCDLFKEYNKGEIIITVEFEINSDCIIKANATAKIKGDNIVSSNIEISKQQAKTNVTESLDDILYYSEINKLIDSENSNKILAKIELYDSFKYLLSVFHEKYYEHNDNDDNDDNDESEKNSESIITLNNLFNDIFNVIQNYNNYTSLELKDIKEKFEKEWHLLLFSEPILLKDSDGLIIEFGGTCIQ